MKYFQGPGSCRWWAFNNSGSLHILTIHRGLSKHLVLLPPRGMGIKDAWERCQAFQMSLEKSRNDFTPGELVGWIGGRSVTPSEPQHPVYCTTTNALLTRKVPHDLVLDKCSVMRESSEVLFRCVPHVEPASVRHLPSP
jgi:hypothetical protein